MQEIVIASFWVQLGIAAFILKPSVYVLLAGAIPMTVLLPTLERRRDRLPQSPSCPTG